MTGLFITFEGIDGCGKSTQLKRLARRLQKSGVRILRTREPGGTAVSETVRGLVLKKKIIRLTPRSELLLYLAARAQHVEEVIKPALAAGLTVLCDRFTDSTIAYQGGARGLNREELKPLLRFASPGLSPRLTFLFDLPVLTAAGRRVRSGRTPDRMELEGLHFQDKVRRAYQRLARIEPRRIAVIDAVGSVEEVEALVWKAFRSRIRD